MTGSISNWPDSAHHPSCPPPLSPLVITRDGRTLTIRVVQNVAQRLLLLDETRTEFPMVALASLGLSGRETEVLGWVAQGKTNPEIGVILGISPRTVQKHLEHVYGRLGVENRQAAMRLALDTARKIY